MTGAQEALPDTGPQPVADARGGHPRPGNAAHPGQWYDPPRLDDRDLDTPRPDTPRPDEVRPSRPVDPRLEGMTYGELRYDDSDHEEPLDDESWYEELRRSAPAYPQGPARRVRLRPAGSRQRPAGSRQRPAAPGGAAESRLPPAARPSAGAGPGGRLRSGPLGRLCPECRGQAADERRTDARPQPAGPAGAAGPEHRFPHRAGGPGRTAHPARRHPGGRPAGRRVPGRSRDQPQCQPSPSASPSARASQVLTAPDASHPGTATVRPGHGLDGPEITSSWPAQPPVELDTFEDFWRDDADEEYTGLFGDREAEFERADAKQAAAKRRSGRRRSGSNDRRLWLGLGGVVVVAAAAIVGVVKFEFPSHSGGPAHIMAAPDKIGAYARTVDLEHHADVAALREKVIKMSSGQASRVVSAVYESGNSAAGNTAQIIMFIGGHLANADPAASITSFTQQYRGAKVVSAGALGGKAACVQEGTGANGVAMCAWFDNDSFGEVVSPTMNATALATAMQTVRPSVEVKK